MRISKNIVDGTGVKLIKALETGRGVGSKVWSYNIYWRGGSSNKWVEMPKCKLGR